MLWFSCLRGRIFFLTVHAQRVCNLATREKQKSREGGRMFSVESIVGGARGFASQRLADIERRPDDAGGAWAQRPKQSSQSFTAMTGNRPVHATNRPPAPT